MQELYSWFLNAARMGVKMLDALAHSATRWVSYPVQILYNIAAAAYSSFHTGQYMQQNPTATINSILARATGKGLQLGKQYTQIELVDRFGDLLAQPYSARGITFSNDDVIGSYNTFDTPTGLSSNFNDIQEIIRKVAQQLDYLELKGLLDFRLQFILGTPIVQPIT